MEISEKAIVQSLHEAIKRLRAELREMGARGKRLIAERYTIRRVVEQTNWLLGRGPKLDFVVE